MTASEPDHLSLVRTAVKYALRHTPYISDYGNYWPKDENIPLTLVDKALIETALLGLILSRGTDRAFEPGECGTLAESIRSQMDLDRLARLVERQPDLAPSLGIVTALLDQQRLSSEPLNAAVLQAFVSGRVWATERLPYRQMETDWVASILIPNNSWDLTNRFYSGSILFSDVSPMYISATDLYALTHSAMFITDFGSHNPPQGYARSGFKRLVETTCTWQLLNDNLDITGELLMAAAYLRMSSSPHLTFASNVLALCWHEMGFLPSPSLQVDEMRQLSGRARTAYAFLHTYHTTYVGALAFDAQRRTGLGKTSAFPGYSRQACDEGEEERKARDVRTIISKIRALMGGNETVAWIDDVISGGENQEVLGVLSDMLLMGAAHTYRLDILRDELVALAVTGLPFSATASDAQKFLSAQQLNPW